MLEHSIVLLILLSILYLTLALTIINMENKEDRFIPTLTWYGEKIFLGHVITIETKDGFKEGLFRGVISIPSKGLVLRFSCEGNPRIEYQWHDILSINSIKQPPLSRWYHQYY